MKPETRSSSKAFKLVAMGVVLVCGLFLFRSCGKSSPLDGQYFTKEGNLIKFGSFQGKHHVVYAFPFRGHYKHDVFMRWEYKILSQEGGEYTLLCTNGPSSEVIQEGYRVVVEQKDDSIRIKTESGGTPFDGTFKKAQQEQKIEYGL